MGRPWGRLYGGTYNHRKIKILAQRLPTLWTYWYVLIDMAIEIDDGGWIYVAPDLPYTFKELAKTMRIRREDRLKILCRTLEELKMITISDKGILLNSFSERNFESDISTPRVQKYREKQKQAPKSETLHGRFGNVPETYQNRTDTYTDTTPPSPPRGSGQKSKNKSEGFSPDFLAFIEVYPNKNGGFERAWKSWKTKLRRGLLPPLDQLLKSVQLLKRSENWQKENGQWIPHVTTFIEDGRWTDVEALKPTSTSNLNPPDQNCPNCQGTGIEEKQKDGRPVGDICGCRRRKIAEGS